MRALLVLAVLALATQVHMSEVTEFYRTFINTIPMDVQTKNRIMNNGLDCLNQAVNTLSASVQNIQYDVQNKDLISILRHAISSIQVFEYQVAPKCVETYIELTSYLENNRNRNMSSVHRDWNHYSLFDARMKQLVGKTIVDVLNKQPNAAAQDLATLISTAVGLMDAQLPTILEFDWNKYVPTNETRYVPEFLKGFFTGLGYTDMAKINATSKCALDIIESLKTIATNAALQRGDFHTRANAFLDSFMTVTDSFERCKKLDMVDTELFQRLITIVRLYPAQSIVQVVMNTILELPTIQATGINMSVYSSQGQYELAGRLYANNLRTMYKGLIF